MSGSRKRAVPAWMLSAAATAGLLAAPAWSDDQIPPALGAAAAPAAESPVQRELRRLYTESGREMPEVPANVQAQAAAIPPSPTTPAAPGAARTPAAPQQIFVPPPSTPAKPNPVLSFFKKLAPGGHPSQKTPAPNTAPKPSSPSAPIVRMPQQTPQYSPYASQPPRRLPTMDAVPAIPQTAANAPKTGPAGSAVLRTNPQPPAASPAPALIVVPSPNTQSTASSGAAPAQAAKLRPLAIPAPAPAALDPTPPAEGAAAPQLVVNNDFPDPFTEMSEEEADEENEEEEKKSPFSELVADDESPKGADTVSATELEDPLAPFLKTLAVPNPADSDAPVLPDRQVDLSKLQPPLLLPPFTPPAPQVAANVPAPQAAPKLPIPEPKVADASNDKMAKIRERGGMKGLKGFCPVMLRDERELKDAVSQFQSSFRGQKFHFASQVAKAKFDADPLRYAPAAYGADVVVLVRDKDVAEGTLDYAAWFKGRLFLFSSEETSNVFLANPAKFATQTGLE